MFTNANVLFRTRFVDGVSTVTRYTQNPHKKQPIAEKPKDTTSAVTVTSKDPEAKRKRVKSWTGEVACGDEAEQNPV